jgi:hypothetical protein
MRILIIAFLSFFPALCLNAQRKAEKPEDEQKIVFEAIRKNDSLLFNEGFNKCDMKQFDKLLDFKFEFYHDVNGITRSKKDFIESIREGLCKTPNKARRELVPESLEVYPLREKGKLYGAIQVGRHKFFAIEKDKPEYQTGEAKFTHLWKLEKGKWILIQGLSFDHKAVQ